MEEFSNPLVKCYIIHVLQDASVLISSIFSFPVFFPMLSHCNTLGSFLYNSVCECNELDHEGINLYCTCKFFLRNNSCHSFSFSRISHEC